jgi:small subunit ribosomal protein S11
MAKALKKKKKNIKLASGIVHIRTSFNNTLVTLTDQQWNKISWGWTWLMWFKWTKQSTPYAAEMLTKDIMRVAKESYGLKEVGVIAKWLWLWRDGVFKWINDTWWIDIMRIKEATPIQFGGVKWKRPKRN